MFQDLSPAASAVINHLGSISAAIGGLGTASFGIVDATKGLSGGVSTRGSASIAKVMAILLPDATPEAAAHADTSEPPTPPALSLQSILICLESNWINGMAHDDQVAIAKSLVKLRLNAALAPHLADLTGLDATVLTAVAGKLATGEALLPTETDAYGRFDLILTTMLDQAYQHADQQYRNTAKLLAGVISVILAIIGAGVLGQLSGGLHTVLMHLLRAALIGALATPLAPVAKDLASAVQAGAQAVQTWGS